MLIFKEQFSNVIKNVSDSSKTVHVLLCWLDLCFWDSLSSAGVTIQELAPGSERGQAAMAVGASCQDVLGSEGRWLWELLHAAWDSWAVCKILPDHTDPGMGNKLISKRQEKQPAGQPELSLPGSLQSILASTSQREKQVPYASRTLPQCSKTAQVRSNANSVLVTTKAPPVGKGHILRDAKGPLHF